jgi:transcriptional antiterminator RfaH
MNSIGIRFDMKMRSASPGDNMSIVQAWFALQTMPRSEKKIDYLLRQKGYECFTPIYRQKRKWSDRTVEIDLPLFPTYVFCYLDPSTIGKVIAIQGVTRIIGFGGKPAEIDAEEIDALKLLGQSNLLREPWAHIPDGTLVQVETGPLAGAQGILCSDTSKRCLVISVTLLQRSVAVHLDENTVISLVEYPKEVKKGKGILSDKSDLVLSLMKKARNTTI